MGQERQGGPPLSKAFSTASFCSLDPQLRDKERQMIKERFKGFNDGLEELCKIQKAWAIPDTEQRDKIRQAQKSIVKETYGSFLHR